MRTRTAPPARRREEQRRRRWVGIAVSCLAAVLTAAVTDALTGVVTDGVRGGWERVTSGESLVLNVAVLPQERCGSQWRLPVGAGPAPRSLTSPDQVAEWARTRGGVELTAPTVELTVRARSGDAVVLRELRVTVLERHPVPAGDIVGAPCGGDQSIRTYSTDLDRQPPVLRPEGDPTSSAAPPVPFPYRVTSSDAEVIRVRAGTRGCDCRWVLDLEYVDGEERRTMRIDDDGRPFRTVGADPVRQGGAGS